jgi:Adenylate and Guanylate cyclase catalytic domain
VSETRKLAAILVSDVVGYSRLAGADEDRILARLRTLRSDLIDPTITVHHGRIVKRTGDGSIIEFRSVVDAVNCAIEVQRAMVERNAGVAPDKRIEFRIGVHLGDVIEEADGDLMGDGVNIAARFGDVLIRVYSLDLGQPAPTKPAPTPTAEIRPAAPLDRRFAVRQYRRRTGAGVFRRWSHGEPHD